MKYLPIVLVAVALAGCGGSDETTSAATTTTTDLAAQNDAVVEQAQGAPDVQAEEGEAAVRKTLTKKLGMEKNGDIHADGTSCYVLTGADALNSSPRHVLEDPSGSGDLVFVQTFTGTPLADCLVLVQDALGW